MAKRASEIEPEEKPEEEKSDIEAAILAWLGHNRTEAARKDYGTHVTVVSNPDGQKRHFPC